MSLYITEMLQKKAHQHFRNMHFFYILRIRIIIDISANITDRKRISISIYLFYRMV